VGSPLRPEFSLLSPLGSAFKKGVHSAAQNISVMAALLSTMGAIVLAYYYWPAAATVLSRYAAWQHSGGLFRTGLAAGFAGGILSELSLIYLRDGGRWNGSHLENMAFRFVVFFISGAVVGKFYEWQAIWFGNGTSWRVLLPKVLVDQFVYSVFWSTPYQTITFRWQALRYSGSRLWKELDGNFVIERMLPVVVTNWMFWIPGVILVYSMPLILQMPLNIFATAIWSLLLASLARPSAAPIAGAAESLELIPSTSTADGAE
jgi:hypothetical protein